MDSKQVAGIALLAILCGVGSAYFTTSFMQSQTKTVGAPFPTGLFLVTMNDTTANRAFNTTYHNGENTGNAMIVTVMVESENSYAVFEVNQTAAYLGTRDSLKAIVGANFTGGSDTHIMEITVFVPWNFYYRLNNTVPAGTNAVSVSSIVRWFESVPPTGFGQIIKELILIERTRL